MRRPRRARASGCRRSATAAGSSLPSFGGYGVDGHRPRRRSTSTASWHVVRVPDAAIYDAGLRYEDLVRAVDVVLTKPGYGIIAECIANDTALVYTSRGRFAEYPVLVREMPRYLRCAYHRERRARWPAAGARRSTRRSARPPPPETPRDRRRRRHCGYDRRAPVRRPTAKNGTQLPQLRKLPMTWELGVGR